MELSRTRAHRNTAVGVPTVDPKPVLLGEGLVQRPEIAGRRARVPVGKGKKEKKRPKRNQRGTQKESITVHTRCIPNARVSGWEKEAGRSQKRTKSFQIPTYFIALAGLIGWTCHAFCSSGIAIHTRYASGPPHLPVASLRAMRVGKNAFESAAFVLPNAHQPQPTPTRPPHQHSHPGPPPKKPAPPL